MMSPAKARRDLIQVLGLPPGTSDQEVYERVAAMLDKVHALLSMFEERCHSINHFRELSEQFRNPN